VGAPRTDPMSTAEAGDRRDAHIDSFHRLEKTLATIGPAWVHALRTSAIARFAELGFPTPQDENWRHTNVGRIARTPFAPAPRAQLAPEMRDQVRELTSEPHRPGMYRLLRGNLTRQIRVVFVNGHFAPELSSIAELPPGARVESLAAALASHPETVGPHLARHARFEARPFVALNTAFIDDGVFVHIPRRTVLAEPIVLVFLSTVDGVATASHPRNLIVVEAESQATIVECYAGLSIGAYLTNVVTEVVAGENAIVEHAKIQRETESAFHVAALQFVLARASRVTSHVVTFGGALVRNEVNALLAGEGAEATLNGLSISAGSQHVDNHTGIEHAAAHCASHELYKGIFGGTARGVFHGRILVRPDAQKTDAKQTNKNLLLSEGAMVDTRPQLEIYADDVKCTHGATIGRLDDNALFYLRSRGVPADEARRLLTYAFASDVVERVVAPAVRALLEDIVSEELAKVQPAPLRVPATRSAAARPAAFRPAATRPPSGARK